MGEMNTDMRIATLLKSTNLGHVGIFQGLKLKHLLNLKSAVISFHEEKIFSSLL